MRQKRLQTDQAELVDWDVITEGDDGEAAFWDEFFYQNDVSELEMTGESKYSVKIIDENSSEEKTYKGVRLEKEPIKAD